MLPDNTRFAVPKFVVNDLAELALSLSTDELNVKIASVVVNATFAPKVTAPVYVCVPEVVTSPFNVIPVPVTANVPDVTAAKLTAPPDVTVKLFVPVFSASEAVIAPPPLVLLLMVSGSAKV
jgi:hypothetical protein